MLTLSKLYEFLFSREYFAGVIYRMFSLAICIGWFNLTFFHHLLYSVVRGQRLPREASVKDSHPIKL